jgi:predicted DNA-binding transcriptional regulator YafY
VLFVVRILGTSSDFGLRISPLAPLSSRLQGFSACATFLAMNRVDRLMATVVHLQSRRVVRAEDIAARFEISVRTVYRDLEALGEAGIPIVAEAGVGYSLVKGYHLPPIMFTVEEASALSLGGKLVEHLTDASLRKQMESALLKIRSVLPLERRDYLDRLERSTTVVAAGSGPVPRLSSEALIPVQRALAERRVLAMDYQGAQRPEVTRRDVEPLGLVYYADNWHLIAYCRLRHDVRDFRTDRIRQVQVRNELFSGHDDFSLKRYLEAAAQAGKFETALVKFQMAAMDRVRREWSCRLVEENEQADGVVVTLLAYSLEWLTHWILSFGSKAQVIAPPRLSQLVANEAQEVVSKYQPPKRTAPHPQALQSLLT